MITELFNAKDVGQKIRSILKWLLIGVVCLSVMAFLLESFFKYQDDKKYPAPGKLYLVNGHTMHLWCEGSPGSTLVLDAGAAMSSSAWRWLMPQLSRNNLVCAFDRSGLGWSESALPPYDGISAATELHQLLKQAGIEQPFVYVGHSLGGMLGRIYHQQYPADLEALVMLEPADPAIFLQDLGEDRGELVERGAPISDCGMRCGMVRFMSSIGVIRLALDQIEIVNNPLFHAQALAEFKARINRPDTLAFLAYRGKYIPEIAFQTADSTNLENLPVSIIYSSNSGELLGVYDSEAEMLQDRKDSLIAWQKTLDLSRKSLGLTEIVNANHLSMVMHENPAEQVSQRLLEIVHYVRKQHNSSSNQGHNHD
jgi:pimeloyl-ACP methyl ester carboxylesterase